MTDLDNLERLAQAATPGPWFRQGRLVSGPDRGSIDIGGLVAQTWGGVADQAEAATLLMTVYRYPKDPDGTASGWSLTPRGFAQWLAAEFARLAAEAEG